MRKEVKQIDGSSSSREVSREVEAAVWLSHTSHHKPHPMERDEKMKDLLLMLFALFAVLGERLSSAIEQAGELLTSRTGFVGSSS